ncbi:energy-coupling factor transporter transmembrane component T [Maridesulfovibrio sp.]|uniref:energy-coupling factor transporter transmembrane component T family protein n=1 Tax=Maridesulfovibrio sp. TaxID=2795000 RepID=UPI002A18A0A8|nr:energy-coupling factor transporter transmembrane component T [Maridesulfovibrio sp.]
MQKENPTLFIEGDSWIYGLSPFSKLAYILLNGAIVYLAGLGWQLITCYLLINLAMAAFFKLLLPIWKVLWRTMLPLALFMIPIHGFLYPGNQTPLATYEFLTVYQEGLLYAVHILLQLSVVLVSSLFFVFSTHPADFIAATTQAGWPPTLAYLLGSPLLMLPAMRARAAMIQAAQRARGLDSEGNIFQRIKGIKPLLAPFVLGSIIEIEQRAVALEVRGFNSCSTVSTLRDVPDSKTEKTFRRMIIVFVIILISYRIIIKLCPQLDLMM